MRGKFIVLEGVDGSGTTTQLGVIQTWMKEQGHPVFLTREPTPRPIGQLIRQALKDPDFDPQALAMLFAADRIEHLRLDIEPALARGEHVVCDRYVWSSFAYQTLATSFQEVAALNRQALAHTLPDLVIWLEIPAEVSMGRITTRPDMDVFERLETQRRVADNYFAVFQGLQQRWLKNHGFDIPRIIISADQPLETVSGQVLSCVKSFLTEENNVA